jgi:hypothetical protein
MINIVCVLRQGGKVGYDASWVEKLQNSVARNLSIPYRFVCLSDVDVPCERIPLENVGDLKGPGWWAKLQLFRPGLFDGPVLYFDLDTVITGSLDELVNTVTSQNDFLMEHDYHFNISSSAILYWNGDYSNIYHEYTKDPEYYEHKYSLGNQGVARQIGDQAVIALLTPHRYINDVCPRQWFHIVSKQDHRADLGQVKVLIFRKAKQKPSTMLDHPLVQQHWK